MSFKKMLFGLIVVIVGFAFSFDCFNYVIRNPCVVNGESGLLVSFRNNNLLIPFIVSSLICLCGIIICWYEAYKR